ncbi:MAG: hypothetical protein ACRD3J_21270, partial [Thermoanaerobaculia bacterium]
MPSSLADAVDDLLTRAKQSPNRLDMLASHLTEAFEAAGLPGLRGGKANEVGIRGLGRQKDWDLAYVLAGKPRLLISLKSILKNLAGTVPNRLDDLMGEVANVQQLSPEIVTGYVVIMDEAQDSMRSSGDGTWTDHFESNLNKIAIRRAPLWNQGLIEAAWVIRINSNAVRGQRLSRPAEAMQHGGTFVRSLLSELYLREPTLK